MTTNVTHGTTGDDNLDGTSGDDIFGLGGGGNDTVNGEGGNDTFRMFGALTADDKIDGGSGIDRVVLNGDYTGANAVVFNADTIVNVEKIVLAQGHSYDLTSNDATVAAGEKLAINASALGASDSLTFDGSAETNGRFVFYAGAGDDTITGGALGDVFDLTTGGNDTVHGGGGSDKFYLGSTLHATDAIDGGTGFDTVYLSGASEDPVTFTATTMTNVESLILGAGFSYNLITNDATVASHATLTVDGSALGVNDDFNFDGSAELDGKFHFIGGSSNFITLTGGAGNDVFDMTGIQAFAQTTLSGGGGNDTFQFADNFDSSSQIIDGGTGVNTLSLNGDYSAVSLVGSGIIDNIQGVAFAGGHSYHNVVVFDDVTGGSALYINATGLLAGDSLSLDASLSSDALIVNAGDGTYTLTGSALNDKFNMGAHFSAADSVEGGGGLDTVTLSGDYSGVNALAFNATTMTDISVLFLGAGHSYDITIADETVGPSQIMQVNALNLGAGDTLTFDGSADTDGVLKITAGAGNDVITGGQFLNYIDLSQGGNDTVHSSGGLSQIYMGAALTAADKIDGGTFGAEVELNGDYTGTNAVTFSTTTLKNIAEIDLDAGHSYDLTSNDATVANSGGLVVDGSFLGIGDSLKFDGSAETHGSFDLYDGLGNDVLKGGGGDDFLSFDGGGTDVGQGNGGADFFDACGHLDSTDQFDGGSGYDIMELTASETASGNYTGADALHLSAAMMLNFEELDLDSGGSYDITTVDANVASGVTFTVDASLLAAGETLTFNGAAETDGFFAITSGAGDDTFTFGAAFKAAYSVDGGAGNDTLSLTGNYSGGLTFGAATMTNVETLSLGGAFGYFLTLDDGNVASGATLTVDGSAASGNETVNGFAELDGNYNFIFGTGATNLFIGGSGNDTFDMTRGGTTSNEGDGHDGNDTFNIGANWRNGHTSVNGGTGTDTVNFTGDNQAFIQVNSDDAISVEKFTFAAGTSYQAIFENGSGPGFTGSTFIVDASALGASDSIGVSFLSINRTDVQFTGGAGNDTVGVDATSFAANSQYNGGAGTDQLIFDGNFSSSVTTFTATTVLNFETLKFLGGFSYEIATNDATVASGKTLTVNASGLGASNFLQFNASAETDGKLAVTGGAGNDVVTFGSASAFANSTFNGGAGTDTLAFAGDFGTFATPVTIASTAVTNVETINVSGGASLQNFAITGDITSGAGTLNIVSTTSAGFVEFDVSGATTSAINFTGGGANDFISFGGNFKVTDKIDGGAAANPGLGDILFLHGNYAGGNALVFNATTITNIEQIDVVDGGNYDITLNAANVTGTNSIGISETNGVLTGTLRVDASAFTTQGLAASGGDNNDTLIGGGGINNLQGGDGNDILNSANGSESDITGGAGQDTITVNAATAQHFFFNAASDSSGSTYDIVTGMNFNKADFDIGQTVTAIDGATANTLSTASFDTDLANGLTGHLLAGDAILFTANAGTLNGHTFLVVDMNGVAGYQSGSDLVIDVTGHTGTLSASEFF